jgi:Rrf2 family protein
MLSKKAQYALYALKRLASEYQKGPVLIQTIAAEEKIPKKFLETILAELKTSGYLSSKKGKGGGYYMIKKPSDVNLAEIIRLFDGAIALLPCVTYNYYESCTHCKDEDTCSLRHVIKELRDASVSILKSHTFQDLLDLDVQLLKK